MKTLFGERKSVKALAFLLTLALILPLTPVMGVSAEGASIKKATFVDAVSTDEFVIGSETTRQKVNFWTDDGDFSSKQTWGTKQVKITQTNGEKDYEVNFTNGCTSFYFFVWSGQTKVVTATVGKETLTLEPTYNQEFDAQKYTVDIADFKNAGENAAVTINVSSAKTVTFPTEQIATDRYTLSGVAYGTSSVARNVELTFSVTVVSTSKKPSVTVNDQPLIETSHSGTKYDFKFTPGDYPGNVKVSITLVDITCTVIVTEQQTQNYTISAISPSVVYGSDLVFSITPDEGYQAPLVTYTGNGKESSTTISPTGTTYTILNVTSDVKITIGEASATTYTVEINPGTGFTAVVSSEDAYESKTNSASINYNGTAYIQITLSDEYKNSTPILTLTSNGKVIPLTKQADGKTYKGQIDNVTSGLIGTVSNVSINSYSVTANAGAGITATVLTPTVSHGDVASISITVAEGYNPTTVSFGTDNNGGWTCESGNNTATQVWKKVITDDTTAKITVTLQKLEITFLSASTCTVKIGNLAIEQSKTSVDYGDILNFTVEPNIGYRIDSVTYTSASGIEREGINVGDNKWRIRGEITEDGEVTINAVPITITFQLQNKPNAAPSTFDILASEIEGLSDQNKSISEEKFKEILQKKHGLTDTDGYDRVGFTFKSLTLESHTIGNENLTVSVTFHWTEKPAELYVLEMHATYSAASQSIVFRTTLKINPQCDEEAQREYNGKFVKVEAYGIFYGQYDTTITNSAPVLTAAKNYIADKNYTQRTVEEVTLVQGMYGRVMLYAYATKDEATGEVKTQDFGPGTLYDVYTQTMTGVNAGAGRSALAWFKLDDGTVIISEIPVSIVANA